MINQQVIVNIGVSGSGKTTKTVAFILANPNFLRINRDDIRKTVVGDLTGYYKRSDLKVVEDMVTIWERDLGHEILRQGYSVVVDNTHLKPVYLMNVIEKVNRFNKAYGKNVEVKIRLFPEDNVFALRDRVKKRDGLTWEQTSYINRQHEDFLKMKEYVFEHHKDKLYEQSS